MQTTEDNIRKNITHYDKLYSGVDVGRLVEKVRNVRAFLEDATQTDTSWHGLYQSGFAERIQNKRVFEIGCGDGLNSLIMAALGADVVANDISKESERIIQQAASRLGLTKVRVFSGNFETLPLELRSFDFVVGKALLHHLTHELEARYLKRTSALLTAEGEARFFEPATNSQFLDMLRWTVPVPGRPSMLNRKAFAKWKNEDVHPERDNSSNHFMQVGKRFFSEVEILPIGSIERFSRLIPKGNFNRRFRRWAHRVDARLPMSFRYMAARSQLIIYRQPIGELP